MLALLLSALTATAQVEQIVIDQQDSGPDVVFIGSPALPMVSAEYLAHRTFRQARSVRVVTYDCPLHDVSDIRRELSQVDVTGAIVVAYGLGARLALQADLQPAAWVLMAPIVDIVPVQDMHTLAHSGRSEVRLSAAERLLGTRDLVCPSAAFASSLRADLLTESAAPLPQAPTIALVSMGDDAASVEAVIPRLSDAPQIQLVRVGRVGWGGSDLSHVDMWTSRRAMRLVRRAYRSLQ